MNRENPSNRVSFSPTQRKACLVIVGCILAVIVTFVAAWILPARLGGNNRYDPKQYPVDTSLDAVLTQTGDAEGNDYVNASVFVGDQFAESLYSGRYITIDQFAGKSGMTLDSLLRDTCVYFEGDSSSYTVPQAMAMMKPRRVVMMLGSNNTDGSLTCSAFIQNYRKDIKAITSAYSYCDVIVCSIPPVLKSQKNAAKTQLTIDEFNQALAVMCNEDGYKFLNIAEDLKGSDGYAEAAYLNNDGDGFNGAGANAVLNYLCTHVYQTSDNRPDTENIPHRAEKAASSSAQATPEPTPVTYHLQYLVEEGKGTLSCDDQTGVTNIEMDAPEKETVTVTAIPADGFTFYKWSDGQTSATRVDNVMRNISVTAMFKDSRVELSIDKGDTAIKVGETLTINATVRLGGKDYDNSGVQWSVNDELMQNGGSYSFTPDAAGSYTIKAGLEVNGNYASQSLTVTVESLPTTITITGANSIPAGSSTTFQANVSNPVGDTTWSCAQQPEWSATGNNAQFTPNYPGNYVIRATNNGQYNEFTLSVTEPISTPAPAPTPGPILDLILNGIVDGGADHDD